MTERIPPPADAATADTHCTAEQYEALYRHSLDDPDGFWAEQAQRIDWVDGADADRQLVLRSGRHQMVRGRRSQPLPQLRRPPPRRAASADTAIIWEGDEPGVDAHASPMASSTPRSCGWRTA